GLIPDPAAAILDTTWNAIAAAVLGPVLGDLIDQFASLNPRDSNPSFDSGWYGYVDKDLRTALGAPVQGAFIRRYCGNGSLDACRASLWAAMQTAVNQLATTQGVRSDGLAISGAADQLRPGAHQLYDALDQPLDLPAGDRIHRP